MSDCNEPMRAPLMFSAYCHYARGTPDPLRCISASELAFLWVLWILPSSGPCGQNHYACLFALVFRRLWADVRPEVNEVAIAMA